MSAESIASTNVVDAPEKTFLGLQNVSILGMLGLGTSVVLGLWLLRAINKSGHLD